MSNTVVVIALLTGFVLGIGIAFLIGKRSRATLTQELEQRKQELAEAKEKLRQLELLEQEMTDYKAQVDDHFVETAALVNHMTQSYKAVYDHLEKGAMSLVGKEKLQKRLANIRSEPVRLEYLGLGSQSEPDVPGYVLVLEKELPDNDALQAQLAAVLGVNSEQLPEALNGVIHEAEAKQLEKLLREYDVQVVLRPTPELFNSSSS